MADLDRGIAYLDKLTASKPEALNALDALPEIDALWEGGLPSGDKTGWPSIDKHYTVAPGQFTVVTGYPGSGKSEWVDALQVNLARQGWRTAFYSPENLPVSLHMAKLIEKVSGKPFGRGPTDRLTREEVRQHAADISAWFQFLRSRTGDPINAKSVIESATPWLDSHKDSKRGLVIDPWNELEHWRGPGLSETEYVSQQLSFIRGWARTKAVHVWLVAHPRLLRRDGEKLPTVTPDAISGSAHFWNKADCAITVERALGDPTKQEVNIHVQKVRFKHIGIPGMVTLRYDRVTGRYHEIPSLKDVSRYRNKGEDD